MTMKLLSQVLPEELALSGPPVWPRIVADEVYDRFIFRRPELAYLVGKRRLLEAREKKEESAPELIGIRLKRVYRQENEKYRRRQHAHHFGHAINYGEPLEDVRLFLESLRRMMKRTMPDRPALNCVLALSFFDYDYKKASLLSWQAPWI